MKWGDGASMRCRFVYIMVLLPEGEFINANSIIFLETINRKTQKRIIFGRWLL